MSVLGNITFACGRLRRPAVRRKLERPAGAGATPTAAAGAGAADAPGTQTEPQLEAATSEGVILPETGQQLLLCSLQLWQQLQRCRKTRARVQVF